MITFKTKHNILLRVAAMLFLLISIVPHFSEAGILDTLNPDTKKCKYIAEDKYQLFSNINTNFAAFKALGARVDGECIVVSGSINSFMDTFFRIFVGIASVAAIINIAYAGIKTMLSESGVVAKGEWKKTVRASLEGLLIALTAWLLLSTINDRTLRSGLNVRTISGIGAGIEAGQDAAIAAAQQAELLKYREEVGYTDLGDLPQGEYSEDGITKSGRATIFGYKDGDGTVGYTGDNGIGNGNLSHIPRYTNYTGDPRSRGIAVPLAQLNRDFGGYETAKNSAYEVHADGRSFIVPIVDTSASNIDFTYGLVKRHFDSTVTNSNSWSMDGVSIKPLKNHYLNNPRPQNPMIEDSKSAGKTPGQIAEGVRNGTIKVIVQ